MITKKTYEELMGSYLKLLPSDMDTREGTLAHTVMSVTAMSIAQMYEELGDLEADAYGSTASGEMLDKTVEIIGLERLGKINAVVRIETGEDLIVGDTLTNGELTYTVTEVNEGYCLAKCNTAGVAGNSYLGDVVAEREGVEAETKIVSIVVAGCDKEDDESLRRRYKEKIFCPVCTGNVSYYKDAIHSLTGVGGIKIEPAYNGVGTVKVIITDSDYAAASDELTNYVKEYLDPAEYSGLGYGVVPIGHSVEVASAQSVDIIVNLEINGGGDSSGYLKVVRAAVKYAIKELNKTWDANDNIVIWNRLIEDAAFGADKGVNDIKVLSINGEISRLILGENQIVGDVYVNGV